MPAVQCRLALAATGPGSYRSLSLRSAAVSTGEVMSLALCPSRSGRLWVLAFQLAVFALPARGQTSAMLTVDQRAIIDAGRDVFLTWDVSDSPWPRACVFQYIESTPEEAAAAFTNYPRHRAYIPGIRKATVSRVINAATTEVDYTLAVPILADEHYTVRDRVSIYGEGASYVIEWTLVRATSTKATDGSARFEPHRIGRSERAGTLMSYCNLVTPGSRLAKISFIRSKALAQVRETAQAIRIEIERLRVADPAMVGADVGRLRRALAGAAAP